jgi:ABC-type multidrug transport system fused ATPase/permease subunit
MSEPRSSGYFRTTYARDTALLDTRSQKAWLAILGVVMAALPFLASPFLLDLANQVLLTSIGAVALMLLTGYAGQISLGHAGLLAAGAFTTGILFKEFGAPFWVTLPASAALGALIGLVFGLPSLRLRGLYLAVSTLALHFMVIHAGQEYETRRGFSTGVVIDSPLQDPRAWYFVLLAASLATVLFSLNLLRSKTGRAWRAIHARESVAAALGIDVRPRQALGVRRLVHADLGRRVPVRLLPRIRLGGSVFAVRHDSICRDGHRRRHRLDPRRAARHGIRRALSLRHRGRDDGARPRRAALVDRIRAELRRVRPRDDPVPRVRAAGTRRDLAPRAGVVPAVAVQAKAARAMSDTLKLEKVEVAYHRVITAVQGISLEVSAGAIVAILGTNGAGKTTTLRAISGFIGLDDARVTQGSIVFRGERIENRPPHEVTSRGIALVPERSKVFENLSVAENIAAAVARSDAPRLAEVAWEYFPALAALRARQAGYLSGRRAPDAGDRLRARVRAAPAARR